MHMSSKLEELHEAWGAFFLAHAMSIKYIEKAVGDKAPLSLDEYDILLAISRHPGGKPRFSELADATVFTRSGITRIANRLTQSGYISREECEEDGRGIYAALTSRGREAMKETWKWYSKSIQSLLDPCFSREEACVFKEFNERLINASRGIPLISIGKRRADIGRK